MCLILVLNLSLTSSKEHSCILSYSCLLDLIVRDWQKVFLKFSLEETIQLLGLEYSINPENQRERNPPLGKIEHIHFREFKYRVIIVNFSSGKVT